MSNALLPKWHRVDDASFRRYENRTCPEPSNPEPCPSALSPSPRPKRLVSGRRRDSESMSRANDQIVSGEQFRAPSFIKVNQEIQVGGAPWWPGHLTGVLSVRQGRTKDISGLTNGEMTVDVTTGPVLPRPGPFFPRPRVAPTYRQLISRAFRAAVARRSERAEVLGEIGDGLRVGQRGAACNVWCHCPHNVADSSAAAAPNVPRQEFHRSSSIAAAGSPRHSHWASRY